MGFLSFEIKLHFHRVQDSIELIIIIAMRCIHTISLDVIKIVFDVGASEREVPKFFKAKDESVHPFDVQQLLVVVQIDFHNFQVASVRWISMNVSWAFMTAGMGQHASTGRRVITVFA